ncbi:MAG: hypothetical protein PVI23_12575 [Maricaulaceae bacterium]
MSDRQLALGFPSLERDPVETLADVACQAAAKAALANWRNWPGGALLLVAPRGAGKSHLGAVWAEEAGARRLDVGTEAAELVAGSTQWTGPVFVDDADRHVAARTPHVEAGFIALLDRVKAGALGPALLTARERPNKWPVETPDLASRLGLPPIVEIDAPSEEDLALVFEKLLKDRGADPTARLTTYVLRRAPRSFSGLEEIAAKLDALALQRKQKITRSLACALFGDEDEEGEDERD